MRIAYLLIVFGDTGGSMVLYNFMDKLAERGHDVYAITPNERIQWTPNFSKTLLQRFDPSKNKPPLTVRNVAAAVSRPARKKIKKILTGLRSPLQQTSDYVADVVRGLTRQWIPSDITISTFCSTAYANYALMEKTVPIYHCQHYEEIFMEGEPSVQMARLTYYLPLFLMSNSTWLQREIRRRIGRDSELLTPGIDTGIFYAAKNTLQKYQSPSKISIVSYYSPIKFKAWDETVAAMKTIFEKAPKGKIEWIVFGGRPAAKPDLPITYAGKLYKTDLADLYRRGHVTFMNSWYESFPLPPLEAMACGSAVVCTPFGTEDYARDRQNALVVPPKNPERLAEALLELIENPKRAGQLAENGVETAKPFTWNRAADRLERILENAKSAKTVIPDFV